MTVEPVSGACDVLIFHPRHDLTIARMAKEDVKNIIEEWIQIYNLRGRQDGIKYIQVFEVRIFTNQFAKDMAYHYYPYLRSYRRTKVL